MLCFISETEDERNPTLAQLPRKLCDFVQQSRGGVNMCLKCKLHIIPQKGGTLHGRGDEDIGKTTKNCSSFSIELLHIANIILGKT